MRSCINPYVGGLVDAGYRDVFSRAPDSGGRTFWIGQLQSSKDTVAEFYVSLYASNEFWVDAGRTNSGFIDAFYRRLFGRTPSTTDRDFWVGRLNSGTARSTVAREIYQSLESRRDRVDRLSMHFLGRVIESSGRDYWAGELAKNNGDDINVARRLVLSSEYYNRAQSRP